MHIFVCIYHSLTHISYMHFMVLCCLYNSISITMLLHAMVNHSNYQQINAVRKHTLFVIKIGNDARKRSGTLFFKSSLFHPPKKIVLSMLASTTIKYALYPLPKTIIHTEVIFSSQWLPIESQIIHCLAHLVLIFQLEFFHCIFQWYHKVLTFSRFQNKVVCRFFCIQWI